MSKHNFNNEIKIISPYKQENLKIQKFHLRQLIFLKFNFLYNSKILIPNATLTIYVLYTGMLKKGVCPGRDDFYNSYDGQ